MNIGVEVENIKMETTEIQSDTVEEVAMHSAKEAYAYCEYGKKTVNF